jgi:KDO2-lipid IV(A) lauroyltransferase
MLVAARRQIYHLAFMKKRNRFVDCIQYIAFRLVAMVMHMFPIETNLRTARLLGLVWHRSHKIPILRGILGRGRGRALENLRHAFPEWNESRCDDVALKSMQHVVSLAVEVIFAPRLVSLTTWRRYMCFNDPSPIVRLLIDPRGSIMVIGHVGNWELLGYVSGGFGLNVRAVFRKLDNPLLNDYLVKARGRRGLKLFDKRGASKAVEDVVSTGGAVAFIADQDAGRKGVFVDFFGRKASTYKSIGLIAREYKAPIAVGYGIRTDPNRFQYELGVEEYIQPSQWEGAEDEVLWITQRFTAALERVIRRAPEQYLWVHRRWKTRPRGEE